MEPSTRSAAAWVTRTRGVTALGLVAALALGFGVADRAAQPAAFSPGDEDAATMAASALPPGFGLEGRLPMPAPEPVRAATPAEVRPAAAAPRASRAERPAAEIPPPWIAPVIDSTGIPVTVLTAYKKARRIVRSYNETCHLTVALLAAIGRVESDHALGGYVDKNGKTLIPILGPRLDGHPGVKAISDSDGGLYDGDKKYDRAVGPMQFIPTTWTMWASDGNADKIGDPGNVYDASLAAGWYLCAGATDLRDPKMFKAAVLRYNGSENYYKTVKAWSDAYKTAFSPVPDTKDAAVALLRAEKKAAADRAAAEAAARAAEAQQAADQKAAAGQPAAGQTAAGEAAAAAAGQLTPQAIEPMSDGGAPAETGTGKAGPRGPVVPVSPAKPAPAKPVAPAPAKPVAPAGEARPSVDERQSQKPATGADPVGSTLNGLAHPKGGGSTPPKQLPGAGGPITPVWAGRGGALPLG